MTTLKLKNHQVWQDLTEILENLDPNSLVQKHLEQLSLCRKNKVIYSCTQRRRFPQS
jgi:hypothetical protein